MAGYRRVNYYELCRLCTSSEGTKMHIFREEGRRRQLPTKIQICLPVQVCEDDSLPKIICSHCVDKLESFYDFRESCVNAEAMLESYFTSLRYSDDFTREGKVTQPGQTYDAAKYNAATALPSALVYVKDESPPKKKGNEGAESPGKQQQQHHQQMQKAAVVAATDGLNSLVQAAGIQIVSDADGTRVQQYKCAMQMQPGPGGPTVVEAATAEARYSYEACSAANSQQQAANIANSQQVQAKVEDGSTQCSETDFNNKSPCSSEDGGELIVPHTQQQTVAFTSTGPGQEMLVHFNFNNKDRDGFLRTEDHAALQRSSIAQIGEFLRMKTVNLVDTGAPPTAVVEVAQPTCERCGKEFEELEAHDCNQDNSGGGEGTDKNGGAGNFACEICGKPFKRKEHLFQHRKLHTGERPYVCSVCSKAFSRKEHLVRHAVSHTGQKMHACEMCGKAFSRKDNLHKHRKTHGVAGPYVCETCGKSFVVKHYYMMHRGSHTSGGDGGADAGDEDPLPYKCDICNKGFTMKQYLTTHKLRHRNKANQQQQSVAMQGDPAAPAVTEVHQVTLAPHNVAPLTTINNAALLTSNILHHVPNNTAAMIQVSSTSTPTAFLCAPGTVSANEVLESYRRLHSA
uniref:Uncharacterized protein n=1 Tax=Timema monikensis TaxID=170555 RepID=A0A7R9E8W0_9NEOP|nr:unnamed protein product [Timema monikensis]